MTLDTRARARVILAGSLAVTALLYVVPFGRTVGWPLVLVSTLAHELGHGLAALVLGGQFHSLYIAPDASGVAAWSGAFGRLGMATVAGAGLVGPAAAACLLLIWGRRPVGARRALLAAGAGLCLIAILWIHNPFGLVFTLLLGSVLLLVGTKAPGAAQSVVILLAVQLALSVFSRGDYLFTRMALTTAGPMPSDVSVMAGALFLPVLGLGRCLWRAVDRIPVRGRPGVLQAMTRAGTPAASAGPCDELS